MELGETMTIAGFWRDFQPNNNQVVLGKYAGKVNRVHYLFPQGEVAGAFTTFADLAPNLKSRDVIILGGVLKEQAIAPTGIMDVLVIGAANRPRQATSAGVPIGGGATWMSPTSPVATTPLIEVREQGWTFDNIFFAPVASSACIRLARVAGAEYKGASHALIRGCKFAGGGSGGIGVEDVGGCYNVTIEDSEFESLTGTAIKTISTGVAIPLENKIVRNRFNACTNAIAVSLSDSLVAWNVIRQTANDTNQKINVVAVSGQGLNNFVVKNLLPDATANVTIAKGYKPGTGDVWRNWVTDSADEIVAVPA
jgi:hypothetical protein